MRTTHNIALVMAGTSGYGNAMNEMTGSESLEVQRATPVMAQFLEVKAANPVRSFNRNVPRRGLSRANQPNSLSKSLWVPSQTQMMVSPLRSPTARYCSLTRTDQMWS